MIKLEDFQTKDALPAEMKTAERLALSYAFDRQKKKYVERMGRVRIWANLENMDADKLDFLAAESRVLFYNEKFPLGMKRELIRNSIYWYMKLGTRQAMEEMVGAVFGSEETSVEEWPAYGGEPFHFRTAVSTGASQESIHEFQQYLRRIKNARSRFDYFIFQDAGNLMLENTEELFYVSCAPCMEGCFCGTMPDCGL